MKQKHVVVALRMATIVILRTRIDEVKKRLLTTDDPIERISTDCGWANVNSLKNTFRRVTGLTMRDFRCGDQKSRAE